MFNPIKVAAASKVAARAELRAKKVSALTTKISGVKKQIADLAGYATATAKRIAHINWETEQAESNGNPDAAEIKESNERKIEALNQDLVDYDEHTVKLNKEVANLQTAIDDVISGKTKTDLASIVEIADGFMHEAVQSAFLAGEFDKEEASA